jgi:hypothetical protein
MVAVGMNSMPPKVIGKEDYLKLDVLMGCQMILDPKGTQTFKGGGIKKK